MKNILPSFNSSKCAWIFRFACLIWIIVQCILTISFTAKNWDRPWPDPVLTIDGKRYMRGATQFAAGEGITDMYHSPGYQAFLGIVMQLAGSTASTIHLHKILSLIFCFTLIATVWRAGKIWFSGETSQLAAALLSSSLAMRYYINMIQYEVLVAFLVFIWTVLLTRPHAASSSVRHLVDFISAILVSAIIWIQVRYFMLVCIPVVMYLYERVQNNRQSKPGAFYGSEKISLLIRSGLPLLLFSVWSAYISTRSGHFIFGMDGSSFRFHVGNNANATGISFPYATIVEPSGLDFILRKPGNFLWLVGQRFLYLWGITPDLWSVPPQALGRPWIEFYWNCLTCFLFFLGLCLASLRFGQSKPNLFFPRTALYCTLAIVLLPPLLIFGSHRFILPVFPIICLFQAYVACSCISYLFNRSESKKVQLAQMRI